ncbi:hypothetical protein B0H13DRAFT_2284400 [Mycena leptocephala]|nr:hypothetical protein B0H13DRAFT_2284400 [Mycena leptocephala]
MICFLVSQPPQDPAAAGLRAPCACGGTDACARLALLEAQIARRDTELEACLLHTGQTFPLAPGPRHTPQNITAPSPSPSPLPTADMNTAMHHTVEQNIALEKELEQLAALLEQARVGVNQPVPPSEIRRIGLRSAIPNAVHQIPARTPDAGHHKRDRKTLHSSAVEQRRRRSGSPARRHRSSSPRSEAVDSYRTIRHDPLHALLSVPDNIQASLDREIAIFGAKIDEFQMEKQVILAQVRAEIQSSHAPATNTIRVGRDIRQDILCKRNRKRTYRHYILLGLLSRVRKYLLEIP